MAVPAVHGQRARPFRSAPRVTSYYMIAKHDVREQDNDREEHAMDFSTRRDLGHDGHRSSKVIIVFMVAHVGLHRSTSSSSAGSRSARASRQSFSYVAGAARLPRASARSTRRSTPRAVTTRARSPRSWRPACARYAGPRGAEAPTVPTTSATSTWSTRSTARSSASRSARPRTCARASAAWAPSPRRRRSSVCSARSRHHRTPSSCSRAAAAIDVDRPEHRRGARLDRVRPRRRDPGRHGVQLLHRPRRADASST